MRKDEGRSMRRSYHLCRRKPCGEAILVMPALCFSRWLPGCGSRGILVFSRMQRDGTQPVRMERLRWAGGRMNGALDKVPSLSAVLLPILLAVGAWTDVDSPGGTSAWGVDERVLPVPDQAPVRWRSGCGRGPSHAERRRAGAIHGRRPPATSSARKRPGKPAKRESHETFRLVNEGETRFRRDSGRMLVLGGQACGQESRRRRRCSFPYVWAPGSRYLTTLSKHEVGDEPSRA